MFSVLRRLKPIDYASMAGCVTVSVATLQYIKNDVEKTNKIIQEKKMQQK